MSMFDLGFACSWWRPREATWSWIPVNLHQGLAQAGFRLHAIDAQPPLALQATLAASLTALGQRPWKYAPAYRACESMRVRHAVRRIRPDAVIEVADLVTPTGVPTYGYQDMNAAVAADYYGQLGPALNSAISCDLPTLRRYADRQMTATRKLEGVLTMGRWFRDYLIESGIMSAQRAHAVGGGVSLAYLQLPIRRVRPTHERKRILFIGREFHRKGGDVLLEAVRHLNAEGDRELQLTIIGPPTWPLASAPPSWLNYYPTLPAKTIVEQLLLHDLFVMPSVFEAYGLVFLEARAAGLPCIGRNGQAMPELIESGRSGLLWNGLGTQSLAELIYQALSDHELHLRCAAEAHQFAANNTWHAVGQRIARIIRH